MKRRKFLTHLGTACMLGLAAGVGGCISSGTSQNSTATPTRIATESPTSSTQSTSLAGTCQKGKTCRLPDCGMWTDLDGNGVCDRGRES